MMRPAMGMKELACQYRRSAEMIGTRINELRERRRGRKVSADEKLKLSMRIQNLEHIKAETARTANLLEHYYGEGGK